MLAPDTVWGEEEFYAKIFLSDKEEKLLKAYADCNFSHSLVDTLKKKLDNCTIELEVIKDTAQFHIWPNDSTHSFSIPIALLCTDKNLDYKLRTLRLRINAKKKPTANSKQK